MADKKKVELIKGGEKRYFNLADVDYMKKNGWEEVKAASKKVKGE